MKFQIQKKTIVEAIDKMYEVATKSIKTDFKLAYRIKIEVIGKDAVVSATNGYLFATCTVPCESVEEAGSVILDVEKAREIFRTLGGRKADDHKIELNFTSKTDQSLNLKDVDSTGRKTAKMQTLSQDHNFTIKMKKGASYVLPAKDVASSLFAMPKYRDPSQYDPMYAMICVHFLTDETRYICGDGMRFAVQRRLNRAALDVQDKDNGDKWVLPADQALIIANILSFEDATDVTLTFSDKKNCFITADNIVMHLKGIPELDYIEYDVHAFRFNEAKAIIDVSREELLDALSALRAVRDKEVEKEGDFHKCEFHANEDGMLVFKVTQGKYQCEHECPMAFHKGSFDKFDSVYSWLFLSEPATCSNHEFVRYFTIDPDGIILAEPFNAVPTNDKGEFELDERVSIDCPARMPDDDKYAPTLSFFFAAATEEEDA